MLAFVLTKDHLAEGTMNRLVARTWFQEADV